MNLVKLPLMLSCLLATAALAQVPPNFNPKGAAPPPPAKAPACERGFTWSAPYCVAAPCPNGWRFLPGPAPKCNNMGSVSTMKNNPCFHLDAFVGGKKVNYAGERCIYKP